MFLLFSLSLTESIYLNPNETLKFTDIPKEPSYRFHFNADSPIELSIREGSKLVSEYLDSSLELFLETTKPLTFEFKNVENEVINLYFKVPQPVQDKVKETGKGIEFEHALRNNSRKQGLELRRLENYKTKMGSVIRIVKLSLVVEAVCCLLLLGLSNIKIYQMFEKNRRT